MIYIEEKLSKYLGGFHSLYIKFNFNQEIIDIIKSCDLYYYIKKEQCWELPINKLSYLLDNFVYIDNIELKLNNQNSSKQINKIECESEYKIQPFNYQKEGILFGLNNPKFLLLDEMGLGKTMTMIYIAKELKKQQNIKHCLIICGVNILKSNWKKEIQKCSDESCIIIGEQFKKNGTPSLTPMSLQNRINQLSKELKEFFIIINVEACREKKIIDILNNGPNKIDMIIIDEIHKLNNSQSQQGSNILKLSAPYMIGATGTLLTNNPISAFMPLKLIGYNPSCLTNFKNTFCILDQKIRGKVDGYKNLDILKDQLEQCSIRRTKDILNLPPKNIIDEFIDMTPEQTKLYKNIEDGVRNEKLKIELNTNNLLAMATRLREATSCPKLLTTENIKSTKIIRCKELVDNLIENKEKVVIFSNFKETVYELQSILKEYNPLIATGDINSNTISQNIDLFNNDPNYKIIIATTQKLGTGVSLHKNCRNLIFIDMPWVAFLYNQACDRIYRIGSDKPVFIYNIICANTIDERVLEIVKTKQAMSDYIVDNKIISEDSLAKLKKYIEDL